jgi:hypothetical protein
MIRAVAVVIALSTGCSKAQPPAPSSASWWCVTTADGGVDLCRRAQAACESEHARLDTAGAKPGACTAQASAFCFLTEPTDGAKRLNCAGTLSGCQKARENSARDPGLAGKLAGDCAEQH